MGWSFTTNFLWPKTLERDTYKAADKAKEIGPVLDLMETGKARANKLKPPSASRPTRAVLLEKWLNEADEFIGSPEFRMVLTIVEGIKTEAERLGTKVSKPESTRACQAIKVAAADIFDSIKPPKLKVQIAELADSAPEEEKEHVEKHLLEVLQIFRQVADKGHPEFEDAAAALREWPDGSDAPSVGEGKGQEKENESERGEEAGAKNDRDKDKVRSTVSEALKRACRNMTQNLANILRAVQNKVDLTPFGLQDREIDALQKIVKPLVVIGNAEGSVTQDLDFDGMHEMLAHARQLAAVYDAVAKKVRIQHT